jgi:hypothetical protein
MSNDENDRNMAILAIAIMILGGCIIGFYAIPLGGLFYVYMTGRLF